MLRTLLILIACINFVVVEIYCKKACGAIDPGEAQDLKAKVKSWIQTHRKEGVVVNLESEKDGFKPIETHYEGNPTKKLMFSYSCCNNTYISFGFKREVQEDWTTEDAKKHFNYMAFDWLPLQGLELPKNWKVYPQTMWSSFSNGVEWELFDAKNKRVKLHVTKRASRFRGERSDLKPVPCRKLPYGAKFYVNEGVPIIVSVDLPVQIGYTTIN